ncbi:efflux RND transporter permease subunit, partial [Pseudomonas aeruginosa]|uniref:efflux RND transporter permease subunit n=1 Tax=Pseudomonas aeruginosa TaxID=287 RepID=UPI003CC633BF
LIIPYKNGSQLRNRDVASVEEDAENVGLAAWANNLPAVVLNIQRHPGANVIEVVDRIKAQLPQLQSTLPGNLDVQVLT